MLKSIISRYCNFGNKIVRTGTCLITLILCLNSQKVYSQISSILSGPKYVKDYDWTPPGLTNVIQLTDAEAVSGVAYDFTDKQVNNYVRLLDTFRSL